MNDFVLCIQTLNLLDMPLRNLIMAIFGPDRGLKRIIESIERVMLL